MELLIRFWQPFLAICLLKKGPQSLPAASALLTTIVLLHILVSFVLSAFALSITMALSISLIEASLLCFSISALLYFADYKNRIQQTLTALFGAGTLLELFSLPALILVMLLTPENIQPDTEINALVLLPLAFMLFVAIWTIVVYGYVVGQALEVSLIMGIIMIFIISAGVGTVVSSIFPVLQTPLLTEKPF